MSDPGWQQSILQGIGTRIEAMAELYPRAYLLLTTVFALTGLACLLLFPLLALTSVAGMYQSLIRSPDAAWLQLLVWTLLAGFSGFASYSIIRFRPLLPAGIVLEREQAIDLFQLVEDTAEQYASPAIDRIVITGAYQLDIVKTPCTALPVWSTHSLVIGLPLMQCLSTKRFGCLLARRLGQFSRRNNPLLNWLFGLRDIWPGYQLSSVDTDYGFLPVRGIFSIYAPLYTVVSTAAARLDELQADSYAMELYGDEEVLDTITTDTVYRLFLREKYWPAIRKLGAQGAAAITKSNAGMMTVLRTGLQDGNIGQWIEKAMSMEQQWDDPWPLLARRLDNVGHVHASIDTHMAESAAEDYLAAHGQDLKAALEDIPPPEYPQMQPWSVRIAGLKRKGQSAIQGWRAGEAN
jgi:hypothetical protein